MYQKKFDPAHYRGGDRRTDNRELEQTHLLLGLPSVTESSPQFAAVLAYVKILCGGMSSRLFQEVRVKRGLAYDIEASVIPYSDIGVVEIYSATTPKKTEVLSRVLCEQVADMAQTITAGEVEIAKTQLRSDLIMGSEDMDDVAQEIGDQILKTGRYKRLSEQLRRVNALTLEDVQVLAAEIAHGNLTVATVGNADNVLSYREMKDILRHPHPRIKDSGQDTARSGR